VAPALLVLEGEPMNYSVTFEGTLVPEPDGSSGELQDRLDELMGSLVGRGVEAAIGVETASAELEITLTVDAEDLAQALTHAETEIREAFRVTQGWVAEWRSATARKVEPIGA